jgi:hypothetical protein
MVKDQRLRVIRRLVTILGKPKSGRLTGQNADTRARGRAANENDSPDLTTDPVRVLTPQQAAVKSVEDALEEHTHDFGLPDPRRIAKWISNFGIDLILATIREEGDRSQLDGKNANYLHQILESRKRKPHGRTAGANTPTQPRVRNKFNQPTAAEILAKRTVHPVLDDASGEPDGHLH